MTKYNWGSIFYVPRDWDGNEDTLHEVVVESHVRQTSSFGKAKALWLIAGREDKAASIDRILNRTYRESRPKVLNEQDILELEEAFAGLEKSLDAKDPQWGRTLSEAEAADLQARYPVLGLEAIKNLIVRYSLYSHLAEARALIELLQAARVRGLDVYFDHGR